MIEAIVFCGLPGSGKTTLAQELASNIDEARHFNTQQYRVEMTQGSPLYTEDEHQLVQEQLETDVAHALTLGNIALIDTRLTRAREHRRYWHDLAHNLGKTAITLHLVTPLPIAHDRAVSRYTSHDGLYTKSESSNLMHINRLFEAPTPGEPSVSLDGTREPSYLIEAALTALSSH